MTRFNLLTAGLVAALAAGPALAASNPHTPAVPQREFAVDVVSGQSTSGSAEAETLATKQDRRAQQLRSADATAYDFGNETAVTPEDAPRILR